MALERMPMVTVKGVVLEVIDGGLDKEGNPNEHEILLIHQKGLKDSLEVWVPQGIYGEGQIIELDCRLSTWAPGNVKATVKFKNNLLN